MKFCKNCGQPMTENQKVCTQCGTPAESAASDQTQPIHQEQTPNETKASSETVYSSHPNSSASHPQSHTTPPVSKTPKTPMSKRNKSLLIGAALLLALLALLFFLVKNHYNPEHSTERIISAMNDKNAGKLAKELKANGETISDDEAKAYIKMIHNGDNVDTFNNQLTSVTQNINNNMSVQGNVTAGDETVLKVSKNGKKFGLFPQVIYEVPTKKVTIEPNDDSKVSFKLNGKDHDLNLVKNHPQTLGTFVMGDYELPAKKKYSKETFKGNLLINMSEGTSYAQEDFDVAYLRPVLTNSYGLDNDTFTLFVNGKEKEYSFDGYEDKVGPFKSGDTVEVYAKGVVEGKTFKTNTVNQDINKVEDQSAIQVELSFNDDEISDYVEKANESKQELAESQNEARSMDLTSEHFFASYMRQNHIDSYRGVKVGMKKDDVEEIIGEPEGDYDAFKPGVKKYGNFAIDYGKKGEKVERIYIVPDYDHIDMDDIEEHYGKPVHEEITDTGRTLYLDGNTSNGFVIVLGVNDDDYLSYMYQKPEEAKDPWR